MAGADSEGRVGRDFLHVGDVWSCSFVRDGRRYRGANLVIATAFDQADESVARRSDGSFGSPAVPARRASQWRSDGSAAATVGDAGDVVDVSAEPRSAGNFAAVGGRAAGSGEFAPLGARRHVAFERVADGVPICGQRSLKCDFGSLQGVGCDVCEQPTTTGDSPAQDGGEPDLADDGRSSGSEESCVPSASAELGASANARVDGAVHPDAGDAEAP